jgi:hypothetical protein
MTGCMNLHQPRDEGADRMSHGFWLKTFVKFWLAGENDRTSCFTNLKPQGQTIRSRFTASWVCPSRVQFERNAIKGTKQPCWPQHQEIG